MRRGCWPRTLRQRRASARGGPRAHARGRACARGPARGAQRTRLRAHTSAPSHRTRMDRRAARAPGAPPERSTASSSGYSSTAAWRGLPSAAASSPTRLQRSVRRSGRRGRSSASDSCAPHFACARAGRERAGSGSLCAERREWSWGGRRTVTAASSSTAASASSDRSLRARAHEASTRVRERPQGARTHTKPRRFARARRRAPAERRGTASIGGARPPPR